MLTINELNQIANYFDSSPLSDLQGNAKIYMIGKDIIVHYPVDDGKKVFRIRFYVNKRHEILIELINQKCKQ